MKRNSLKEPSGAGVLEYYFYKVNLEYNNQNVASKKIPSKKSELIRNRDLKG